MSEDFKAGKIEAYQEMKTYANSMIGVNEPGEATAWLDMSFFAFTGIDELENGIPDGLDVAA